ncbi:hypothetical protein T06_9110 [Trichinella sp. T6]|nr:hypothetical protein T06_9110 [Trichinella sp. T6]
MNWCGRWIFNPCSKVTVHLLDIWQCNAYFSASSKPCNTLKMLRG